jgi:hypothetical protein
VAMLWKSNFNWKAKKGKEIVLIGAPIMGLKWYMNNTPTITFNQEYCFEFEE